MRKNVHLRPRAQNIEKPVPHGRLEKENDPAGKQDEDVWDEVVCTITAGRILGRMWTLDIVANGSDAAHSGRRRRRRGAR